MNVIFITVLLVILSVWITGFIVIFRKQLSCMVGMMAAMALGMSVSLSLGVLLTLWIPGQFFQSTVISMLVGGTIGIIAGAPISLMAVMDGLLSGIMGGMMGTMLMVMMPSPYAEVTVNLMSVLCIGVLFFLFLMLQGEIKPDTLRQKSFLFSKPLSMFLVISLTLTSSVLINFDVTSGHHKSSSISELGPSVHVHVHDISLKHKSKEEVDNELFVKATEFSFSPTSIRVVVGQKIRITLDNLGQEEHDFEIVGTNIHIHAASGQKNSMVVSINKAGYYQIICTLPGHQEAGMTATIHVTNTEMNKNLLPIT
ncbi:MAG: cupredoxin domain-containing protein [Candidatus Pristimantibacillus sp.]